MWWPAQCSHTDRCDGFKHHLSGKHKNKSKGLFPVLQNCNLVVDMWLWWWKTSGVYFTIVLISSLLWLQYLILNFSWALELVFFLISWPLQTHQTFCGFENLKIDLCCMCVCVCVCVCAWEFKGKFGTACSEGETGLNCHAIKLQYQQMHTVSLYVHTGWMTLLVLCEESEGS